jgi:hypothetical protein
MLLNPPLPDIRILDPNPGKDYVLKYKFDKEKINGESILQFVNEFKSGKIPAYYKN